MSFSLLFDDMDVLISNSSGDKGDSSSSCDHNVQPMANLDAQLVLDVYGDGIVSMGDMPVWDMECLLEEEPEVDMDATMALNVAKTKFRLCNMKGERKGTGSSIIIATDASDASTHVS